MNTPLGKDIFFNVLKKIKFNFREYNFEKYVYYRREEHGLRHCVQAYALKCTFNAHACRHIGCACQTISCVPLVCTFKVPTCRHIECAYMYALCRLFCRLFCGHSACMHIEKYLCFMWIIKKVLCQGCSPQWPEWVLQQPVWVYHLATNIARQGKNSQSNTRCFQTSVYSLHVPQHWNRHGI